MNTRGISLFEMNFIVYSVDEKNNIIETVAAADHFSIANAAFIAAPQYMPGHRLQMRNGARIMKTRLPDGRIVD